jgi:hypothetical protein
LRGAENQKAFFSKDIGDAGYKRRFRTDDREIDFFGLCELEKLPKVGNGNIHAFGYIRNTSITGSTIELFKERALFDFPRQGMFPASASDNQNVHTDFDLLNGCLMVGLLR